MDALSHTYLSIDVFFHCHETSQLFSNHINLFLTRPQPIESIPIHEYYRVGCLLFTRDGLCYMDVQKSTLLENATVKRYRIIFHAIIPKTCKIEH